MALILGVVCHELPCESIDPKANIQAYYYSFRGLQERTGANDHPLITLFNRTAGVPDRSPWCASSVCFVHVQFGLPVPAGCAWSPSWFPEARQIPIHESDTADVFGIHYAHLGRIGHVGFVDGWDRAGTNARGQRTWMHTAEGNTSLMVDPANPETDRNGQGWEHKRRHIRTIAATARWWK